MKDSILQKDKVCFLCGRNGADDPLEHHHCMSGPNRKLADEDGLWVWLCGNRCHRNGPEAVHRNPATDLFIREEAQRAWESTYGTREEFMARYGKNYLDEGE